MNIPNAFGFLVLGTLMQVAPDLGCTFGNSPDSVQAIWVAFMSWVIGGVGFAHIGRIMVRLVPELARSVVPESLLQSATPGQDEALPAGARVGAAG